MIEGVQAIQIGLHSKTTIYKAERQTPVMKKIIVKTQKKDLCKIEACLHDTIYAAKEEDNHIRITLYTHDNELDEVINNLEEIVDMRYKKCMIEVYTPEFIISSALERSERKDEESPKPPVEKLIDSTRPHVATDISKIALATIAGMIALTGLFMNNVAIIIGAMLLSPLLGPIYAFTINVAVGRGKYVVKSLANLGLLLGMVVLFSYVTTVIISRIVPLSLTPEILARMDSSVIYILMAVLLGFASIFALSRDISESIAGVAIAAALLPPAVVVGISLVLYPSRAVDSLVLTLENVLGLMAGGLCAVLFLDIEPRRYHQRVLAKRFIARVSLVLAVLLGLLLVLTFLM
jgi:uncharacterized hydrophobic protein (TIGR00341 family)